jgi:hypothetical protein
MVVWAIAALSSGALGCGKKELTRNAAKRLLVASQAFQRAENVPLNEDAFRIAVEEGIWRQRGYGGEWVPTRKGQEYFESRNALTVKLVTPLERRIHEVTGITAGTQPGATAMATFSWSFERIPPPVARYAGLKDIHYDGRAEFRLFDDGWRVETIEYGEPIAGSKSRGTLVEAVRSDEHRARQTMWDMREIARAWEGRATDTNTYAIGGIETFVDGETALTPEVVRNALAPTYIRSFPAVDGWNRPFDFSVRDRGNTYEIRSRGSNGLKDPTPPGISPDPAADIVFSNGSFVSSPVPGDR